MSNDEKARETIAEVIKARGVYVVKFSSTYLSDDSALAQAKVYSDVDAGYVYSIGFHELGLPEIFILVGPSGNGYFQVTGRELEERVKDAQEFIQRIYDSRHTFKFDHHTRHHSTAGSRHGLSYVLVRGQDEPPVDAFKNAIVPLIGDYYRTNNYGIVAFSLCPDNSPVLHNQPSVLH